MLTTKKNRCNKSLSSYQSQKTTTKRNKKLYKKRFRFAFPDDIVVREDLLLCCFVYISQSKTIWTSKRTTSSNDHFDAYIMMDGRNASLRLFVLIFVQ